MRTTSSIALVGISMLSTATALAGHSRDPEWGPGQLVITGGGCPIETPDGLSLMFASGRAGTLDLWVLDRPSLDADWSAPKRLGEPVNTDTAAEFCPAPKGRTLYFVSDRPHPEACGNGNPNGDIYVTRQSPAGEWSTPEHLPCAPYGPNTGATERSPSLVRTWYGTFLFFSTLGASGDDDIYVSRMNTDGEFEQGHVVAALSTVGFQDQMPTVRASATGGFEVTFNSDRQKQGDQDVYYATAWFLPYWWSMPVNAGPNVNTSASETRASLSSDGKRLYYGRGDIYVSERQ